MPVGLPRLDQRIDDLPRQLDLLAAREGRVAAREHLAEHVLVRVRKGLSGQLCVVQLHAGGHHLEAHAGPLGSDPKRDAFVGLNADHDQGRDAALPAPGHAQHRSVAQLDHDLGRAALQRLAAADEDRHAVPSPVLDRDAGSGVRLASRVGRNPLLVEVTLVLPSDCGARVERRHRTQGEALGAADVVGVERDRRLHGDEREELQDVVLDHVAHGSDAVVIPGAESDAFLFGGGDEDALDEVAVPDRLEQRVGEAKREHVLDGVLGEVMVDAEDLLFLERRRKLGVELARRRKVVSERLLDDDPARLIPLGGHSGLTNRTEDVGEGLRRRGEVEDRRRRTVQHRLHRREAGWVPIVELHPLRSRRQLWASARLVHDVAKLLLRRVAATCADDSQRAPVARRQVLQ